jgi:hypothetical protein
MLTSPNSQSTVQALDNERKQMKTLIRVYSDGAKLFHVEPDAPCTDPKGHEFDPLRGAMFGAHGSCCAHCGAYSGSEVEEA